MAVSVQEHFRGAQKFLDSCKALPNFASLQQKQFGIMAEKVDKLKGVSTDMVPGLMAIISAMNLTKDQVTTLQTKVAEKVEDFDTLKKRERRCMQDYTNLAYFMNDCLWAEVLHLQKNSFAKREILCQKLCSHMARLSLECPSEPTVAWLVSLLFHTEWSTDGPSSTEKFDIFTAWKPIVKRQLKKSKVDGLPFMAFLPNKPELLPKEMYELAFAQRPGFFWPTQVFRNVFKSRFLFLCVKAPAMESSQVEACGAAF